MVIINIEQGVNVEDKIYDLLKGWANIPTWHTSHPMDQERFSLAMNRIVSELGTSIDIEAFESALKRHAEQSIDMLGNPTHWDEVINRFVLKAETIFTYEHETSK